MEFIPPLKLGEAVNIDLQIDGDRSKDTFNVSYLHTL